MTMWLKTLAMIGVSLSAIACVAQKRSPEPVPVDRVECARCRMLISTDKGGGQIVSAHEETRFYDDIACLAADWKAHSSGATAFVRLSDGAWARVSDASYAQPPAARTAMASGLAAYATIADAKAADANGAVRSWDEIVAHAGER
jgi:hypothetical protein